MKRIVFALLMLCMASLAFAMQPQATTPNVYRNLAEETRFHALATSLRCVMCQNESLADSQAPIAHDLRREILELMRQGKSDAQIRDFLVARYGEFVLYKPRIEPATWLLWFGPLALFVVGGVALAFIVHRRAARLQAQPHAPESPIESSEDW
ncbi:MAG TPA: cytochrome c-type biogenesis protein [Xanthomonadaceae bacterium]|nr:cytochrome c-type biogenesis protein [Xanthomonadaceae bacterium]